MLQPHIQLDDTLFIPNVLLPGDPARLDRIAPFLTDVKQLAFNREFRSLSGTYKNVPVLAMSTGIGGSSCAIAVEELSRIGVKNMIRIGSCGAMQNNIDLGDLIIACGAVREDGASNAYAPASFPAVPDYDLLSACDKSARENNFPHHIGIIHSHESFYTDDTDEKTTFWSKKGVLCADMETASLFVVGKMHSLKTASILNNVVLYGQDTVQSV